MKKTFILAAAATAAATMSACAVVTETRMVYTEAAGRNIEPTQKEVVIAPMLADLEILTEERIKPYVQTFPYVITQSLIDNIENFKQTALLNAAQQYNADTMVAASILVETSDEGTLKITVSGYPARYRNFRKFRPEDRWITDMGNQDFERINLDNTLVVKE